MNEKLNKALKRANMKIAEVKEKYKEKMHKKCHHCNNDIDVTMGFGTFD
jgi:heterodisulfide reductase subunit B